MKKLIIENIKFKNFFSYGNQLQEFDFSKGNFNLVIGNTGQGKSSLYSTPSFLLYGKTDRALTQNSIINSINKKNLLVEGKIKIISNKNVITELTIKRGIKPKIQELYINGEYDKEIHLFQDKINSFLNIPIDLFFKIVFLTTTVSESFYKLSKGEREKFFDNFIDLEFIDKIKEENLKEININSHELTKCKGKIEILQSNIKGNEDLIEGVLDDLKREEEIQQNIKKETKKLNEKLNEYEKLSKELSEKIENNTFKLNKSIEYINDIQKTIIEYEGKLKNLKTSIFEVKKNLEKIKDLNFEDTNCQKEINEKLKPRLIEKKIKYELKIKEVKKELKKNKDLLDTVNKSKNKLEKKINELKKIKQTIENKKEKLKLKLDNINKQGVENLTERSILYSQIETFEKANKEYKEKINELEKWMIIYERKLDLTNTIQYILNKKFKPFVLTQIYPFLAERINYYLNFFNFHSIIYFKDKDILFKGSGRYNYKYDNFSGGEKRIINIATLFAFKDLLEAQIGIQINLLIFDEYVANLSLDELDNIIPKIYEIAIKKNLNVFISTHNPNIQKFYFDNIYEIKKDSYFSKIYKK